MDSDIGQGTRSRAGRSGRNRSRVLTRRSFLGTSLAACLPLAAHSERPLSASATFGSADAISGSDGWKLGIITDEIAPQLETAVDFISSYLLRYCELREIWGTNIMNVAAPALERARTLIRDHGLAVSDIASPIFKWNLPKIPAKTARHDTFQADFTEAQSDELLKKSFEIAHYLGTRKVRIFSYWRVEQPEKAYPYVRDRLGGAAELASRHDIMLVLENEHTCNVGTGAELGRILSEVNAPSLRGNWDPGNAAMLGETPFPDGYGPVRGKMSHMHVKDVRKAASGQLEWAPVGGGFIDWRGQIQALKQDGYHETLSLETHYRRPDGNTVESTRESLNGLLKLMRAIPQIPQNSV